MALSTIQAETPITVNIYNTNFLTATIPSSATVVSLSCIGGVAGSPVSVTLKAPNVPTTSTITTALAGGTAPTLFTVAAPATVTMTGASLGSGIAYTFTPAAACNNTAQPFTSQTYTFRAYTTAAAVPNAPASAAADVSVTVVLTSSATSTLVAAPVTLKCTKAANGSYSEQGHQNITITSGYPGGVSYTWTASGIPGWLGVSTYSGTRTTTPASGSTYTLTVDAGCGGFAAGTSTTANIHFVTTGPVTGVSDKVMAVTLMVVSPTTFTCDVARFHDV